MLLSDFFPRSPATPAPGEDVELDRIVGLIELSGTPVTPQRREIIDWTTTYANLAGLWMFEELGEETESPNGPTRTDVFDEYEEKLGINSFDLTDIACHALQVATGQPSRNQPSTHIRLYSETIHGGDGEQLGVDLMVTITRLVASSQVSLPLRTFHDTTLAVPDQPTYVEFLGYAEAVYGSYLDLLTDALAFVPDLVESLTGATPTTATATG